MGWDFRSPEQAHTQGLVQPSVGKHQISSFPGQLGHMLGDE